MLDCIPFPAGNSEDWFDDPAWIDSGFHVTSAWPLLLADERGLSDAPMVLFP